MKLIAVKIMTQVTSEVIQGSNDYTGLSKKMDGI
jgi:hypothetical protein